MHAIHQLRMFETHGGGDDTGKILVTQRQVAQLFDLSASAVARWPIEPCRRDGRVAFYDLKQCLRHRLALDGRPDLATERARLASAQADKAQLGNAEHAGRLVAVEAVLDALGAQVAAAKSQLLGLGSRLGFELCSIAGRPSIDSHKFATAVDREVRKALQELSVPRAAAALDIPAPSEDDLEPGVPEAEEAAND